MRRELNHSLLTHNTFGMAMRAAQFAEYESVAELAQLLADPDVTSRPMLHIGAGSNLLFTRDYEGTILHSAIRFIRPEREAGDAIYVRVGSGVVWDDFVAHAVEQGWYGAENLSLIPGEAGASAVQNIGAYGVEAADLIEEVEVMDVASRELHAVKASECAYGYRTSRFKHDWRGRYVVTSVLYRLSLKPCFKLDYGNLRAMLEGKELTAKAVRDAVIAVRESKLPDPKVMGNAGSFFMNPVIPRTRYEELLTRYPDMPHYPIDEATVKVPAAWLIDRAGLKGKTVGGAAVHDKQCLVIVNRGGATPRDVIELAELVSREVEARYGIVIRPEVNYI
jgi:UDP-N-acetylmuramate dehydrogenase